MGYLDEKTLKIEKLKYFIANYVKKKNLKEIKLRYNK